MIKTLLAIGSGAVLGAWMRWFLGLKLNALFPTIPPGTLVANIAGGYIIGAAIAFFAAMPQLSPEWRLFVITGFCGALTTFSTFSAESVALIQQDRLMWGLAHIGVHVGASIIATLLGIATIAWIRSIG